MVYVRGDGVLRSTACRVDAGAVDVGCPYSCFAPKCFAGAVVVGHAVIPRVSGVLLGAEGWAYKAARP